MTVLPRVVLRSLLLVGRGLAERYSRVRVTQDAVRRRRGVLVAGENQSRSSKPAEKGCCAWRSGSHGRATYAGRRCRSLAHPGRRGKLLWGCFEAAAAAAGCCDENAGPRGTQSCSLPRLGEGRRKQSKQAATMKRVSGQVGERGAQRTPASPS